jgi:hypothetical protein
MTSDNGFGGGLASLGQTDDINTVNRQRETPAAGGPIDQMNFDGDGLSLQS